MKLNELYNDKETLNIFHDYQVQFIKEEAVRMIFNREKTEAIADAKELIDKSFDNLSVLFNPKPKKQDLKNQSR